MSTPENIRYHAAGHLAAAHALILAGDPDAALTVLRIIETYLASPRVAVPPAVEETLDSAIRHPSESAARVAMLEQWFCDPFNTVIEKSGARFQ